MKTIRILREEFIKYFPGLHKFAPRKAYESFYISKSIAGIYYIYSDFTIDKQVTYDPAFIEFFDRRPERHIEL